MYRPFRILLVDDVAAEALRIHETDQEAATHAAGARGGLLGLIGRVIRLAEHAERNGSGTLELFTTGEVSFRQTRPRALVRALRGEQPCVETVDEVAAFLRSIDVLLLDLQGVGRPPPYLRATRADVPDATEEDLKTLNTVFGGAGFYLAGRRSLIRECQAVIILSAYDPYGSETVPSEIARFLDPWCNATDEHPWTVKWSTSEEDLTIVGGFIEKLFEAFAEGYVSLHSLGPIEFASAHDLPVLIVGESGTGKEYIARQIHRRWVHEKVRHGIDSKRVPDRFHIVNCAGLSPDLARAELFGHLRGSFTDAGEHRLGTVLSNCGLSPPYSRKLGTKDVFEHMKRMRDIKEVLKKFEDLNASGNREQAKEFAYKSWDTVLRAFGENEAHSLLADIGRVAATLEERARSVDYVEQYRRLILQTNRDKVRHVADTEYDLEIVQVDGGRKRRNVLPLGTLFLDEFAELPVEVATLLLRYLESFEVQPLGYPGVLLGAQVRVIAGTSDPRIARLAGVNDMLGTWRSKAELDLPIRQDLVFRVMAQVIRAKPIRPVSAPNIVAQMIDAHRTANTPTWSKDAVETLGELVKNRLEDMKDAIDADANELSVFGHRRQLSMFIRLVNEYVGTAHERGIRSIGPEVTADSVRALWRSNSVSAWESNLPSQKAPIAPDADNVLPAASTPTEGAWSLEKLKANFTDGGKRYGFAVCLYERMLSSPQRVVPYKECMDMANALMTEEGQDYTIPIMTLDGLQKLKNQVQERLNLLGSGLEICNKRGRGYFMVIKGGEQS